jgi:hypothetical protein
MSKLKDLKEQLKDLQWKRVEPHERGEKTDEIARLKKEIKKEEERAKRKRLA